MRERKSGGGGRGRRGPRRARPESRRRKFLCRPFPVSGCRERGGRKVNSAISNMAIAGGANRLAPVAGKVVWATAKPLYSGAALESPYWNEPMETMPRPELDAMHLRRLKALIRYAYHNIPMYREI